MPQFLHLAMQYLTRRQHIFQVIETCNIALLGFSSLRNGSRKPSIHTRDESTSISCIIVATRMSMSCFRHILVPALHITNYFHED